MKNKFTFAINFLEFQPQQAMSLHGLPGFSLHIDIFQLITTVTASCDDLCAIRRRSKFPDLCAMRSTRRPDWHVFLAVEERHTVHYQQPSSGHLVQHCPSTIVGFVDVNRAGAPLGCCD